MATGSYRPGHGTNQILIITLEGLINRYFIIIVYLIIDIDTVISEQNIFVDSDPDPKEH